MNIAYRFRIYPTEEQKILLGKTFGCCRFLYNQMLNDKIREYAKTKKMLKNTPAMYKKEYPFLKEVDSLALANVQLHLENTLQACYMKDTAVKTKLLDRITVLQRYLGLIMQCREWQCFQKRLRRKKQDFLEKMKKDWRGNSESCQDVYGEVIIMNCRKRKLPDVMKRYEISEEIICTNLAEGLQTVMMRLQWKIS